jgi:hypothetical protein
LHYRVLNFVGVDWLLIVNPSAKIFSLQHLLKRDPAVQPNHIFVRHRAKPIAIANGLSAAGIENLEGLFPIRLRIVQHLFVRQMRSCCGPTAGIANHSGEIADDQNSLMSEILKFPQLPQHNCVTKVNVGCRWVDTKLDAERPPDSQLFAELSFANDLGGAFF